MNLRTEFSCAGLTPCGLNCPLMFLGCRKAGLGTEQLANMNFREVPGERKQMGLRNAEPGFVDMVQEDL